MHYNIEYFHELFISIRAANGSTAVTHDPCAGPDYPIGTVGTVPRAYEKIIIQIIQYFDVIK